MLGRYGEEPAGDHGEGFVYINVYFPVYYCSKTDLYEMSWSLRDGLRDSLVAAAPYGGPIGTN